MGVRFEHLKLGAAVREGVERVDVVMRVGFVTFMIVKKKEEKGKYWQKEAVIPVDYEGEPSEQY